MTYHIILYYKAKSLCICLFVCLFSLSAERLMNRLTQTRKIGNDCRVNFSWSSEHIFNFLRFVITSFLKNELNDLAYASRNQNARVHYSRYVTEGGDKMLIRNNDRLLERFENTGMERSSE